MFTHLVLGLVLVLVIVMLALGLAYLVHRRPALKAPVTIAVAVIVGSGAIIGAMAQYASAVGR
ncbi:hypothetical protein [Streptomyces sp. NPDC058657]|uniref:hypothetical protein n=1 Tax=unclassified Streptomyces TaxID=2593676 RepID=UPI00365DCC11